MYLKIKTVYITVLIICFMKANYPHKATAAVAAGEQVQITNHMTSSQVTKLVNANRKNAPEMYRVLMNALAQHQTNALYNSLDSLANKEPNNPIVLESFCLTWNAAQMMFPPVLAYDSSLNISNSSDDLYHQRLQRAYKIDPKPWIALIADGLRQIYSDHTPNTGIHALRKAVKIAPEIAYTHYALAYGLSSNNQIFTSYPEAKSEAELAFKLHPLFWSDAMLLFDINAYDLPNHAEALKWKNIVLSFTPDHSVLDPITRHALESYK